MEKMSITRPGKLKIKKHHVDNSGRFLQTGPEPDFLQGHSLQNELQPAGIYRNG